MLDKSLFKNLTVSVIAASLSLALLTGCNSNTQSNTTNDATSSNTSSSANPPKSSSNSTPSKTSDNSNQGLVDSLDLELKKLFENPTKGSTDALIRKFHENGRFDPWELDPNDTFISSSISAKQGKFTLDKNLSLYATFIPVCSGENAKFILLENGKNIAEGPCSLPNIVSFGPPENENTQNSIYTYEIIGTDSHEVTLYQRKEKP